MNIRYASMYGDGTIYADLASYNRKNDTWQIASYGNENGIPSVYWTEAHAPDSPDFSNWRESAVFWEIAIL